MKSFAKKIVATALTVASIATMTTCIATANAANMEYHIDTTRKASLTLHKYEIQIQALQHIRQQAQQTTLSMFLPMQSRSQMYSLQLIK